VGTEGEEGGFLISPNPKSLSLALLFFPCKNFSLGEEEKRK